MTDGSDDPPDPDRWRRRVATGPSVERETDTAWPWILIPCAGLAGIMVGAWLMGPSRPTHVYQPVTPQELELTCPTVPGLRAFTMMILEDRQGAFSGRDREAADRMQRLALRYACPE